MTSYANFDCNSMEILYQRRCAKYLYVVPEGLRELMADITREVLRCHPKEIYCFIADYLDALFITRENARVAALFVEDVTEAGQTLQELIYRTRLTVDEAVRAVRIIQRAFRRHLALKKKYDEPIDPYIVICKMMLRLNITYDKASEAAKIIQHAWRCYKIRMEVWRARFENAVNWKEASSYTLRLYKKYAATWEYTKAATLIQASYRGYYARRLFKLLAKKKPKCPEEDIDVLSYLAEQYKQDSVYGEASKTISTETLYVMYDEYDRAARTIQRAYKKHTQNVSDAGNMMHLMAVHHEELRTLSHHTWDTDDTDDYGDVSSSQAKPGKDGDSSALKHHTAAKHTLTPTDLEALEENIKRETADVN